MARAPLMTRAPHWLRGATPVGPAGSSPGMEDAAAFVLVVCGWWVGGPGARRRRTCEHASAELSPWSAGGRAARLLARSDRPRETAGAGSAGRGCGRVTAHAHSRSANVVEFECSGDQRLANLLRKTLPSAGGGEAAQRERVETLIHLGAVYVRKCKENKRGRQLLPWARRLEDGQLRKGSLVRVYTDPARFPVGDFDWRARILFEDSAYLIVDKPAGIPYQATTSNFRECLVQALTSSLGYKVWGLHRCLRPTPPPPPPPTRTRGPCLVTA
jgi:hypothetical protein